jgi:ubiquinone/menaquinone biosynthesis C-methylase UbiE
MPFEELKSRQSVMWGSGPYEPIVEITKEIHHALVEALRPQTGERWLDVATGTGAVALLAGRAGADVTGLDLSPVLIETAKGKAAAEGLGVDFEAGDAEALPYDDASFDVVCSAIGTQFAPDHAAVARELARVCRPGGRLGLACWTPESGVAAMPCSA